MSKRIYKEFLTSRFFLIGLFLLIFNDHFLKYAYSSFLTGKLSDFAGLFVFPIFFSVFWYDKRKLIYVLTGIGFIFWKSFFSQPIIDFLNLSRVVDYSDLMALIILPISLKYINEYKSKKVDFGVLKPLIIGVFSLFAFVATTVPKLNFETKIDTNKDYLIPMSKKNFFLKWENEDYASYDWQENRKDSLFYCDFSIPKKRVRITATIRIAEKDNATINIHLDSIISYVIKSKGFFFFGSNNKNIDYMNSLDAEDYENAFKENVIDKLETDDERYREGFYFINRRERDEEIKSIKMN